MKDGIKINVTLAPEHAAKLKALADRTQVQEGTLARSLLSAALDQTDPDAGHVTSLLDAIPGADERMTAARSAADAGKSIPLHNS